MRTPKLSADMNIQSKLTEFWESLYLQRLSQLPQKHIEISSGSI